MNDLGIFITDMRNRRGIATQKAFATAIKKDASWVSHLERGTLKAPIEPDVMRRIADVLNVPMMELLRLSGYLDNMEAGNEVCVMMSDPRAELLASASDLSDADVRRLTRIAGILRDA